MRLYCIYDRLAEEAGPIFEAKNDAVAWRMIMNTIKEYNQEEYCIYCVGEFDHGNVRLTAYADPVLVLSKNDFVEEEQSIEKQRLGGVS